MYRPEPHYFPELKDRKPGGGDEVFCYVPLVPCEITVGVH